MFAHKFNSTFDCQDEDERRSLTNLRDCICIFVVFQISDDDRGMNGVAFKTTPKDCGDSTSSLYNLRYIHSKIKEHMMPKCLTNDEAYPGKECLCLNAGQIHPLG